MLSLLTVAILSGAPHVPAAYKAAERPLLAIERPFLLARLQGEWLHSEVVESVPGAEPRFQTGYLRLVVKGDLVYRYSPVHLAIDSIDPVSRETVWRIEKILPTKLRVVAVRVRGKEVPPRLFRIVEYSVQGDSLRYDGVTYPKVTGK